MNLLSSIPVWVYYVILLITFIGSHVLAFEPTNLGRKPGLRAVMRIGSSLLLLVGLVIIQPSEPATVLLALLSAGLGGFVSGKAAPPYRSRDTQPTPGDEAADAESALPGVRPEPEE